MFTLLPVFNPNMDPNIETLKVFTSRMLSNQELDRKQGKRSQ